MHNNRSKRATGQISLWLALYKPHCEVLQFGTKHSLYRAENTLLNFKVHSQRELG